jgi:hypothetical protein
MDSTFTDGYFGIKVLVKGLAVAAVGDFVD